MSYYRQGLELALTTTATPDAGYSSYNFAIDGSTVDNPFTVTADHDGKTVTLGTQNPDPMHFEQTAADVYHIHTADGWNVFCDALDDNDTYNRFSGKIVYLDDDITVARMAGSDYHDFCGTFDGENHTVTIDNSNGAYALFGNVSNGTPVGGSSEEPAIIRRLHVQGTINPHCGLVRINKLVFSVCFFGRYFWGPHKFYRA